MGQRAVSLFLEKNLCHYTAATGQWFTTAYSPYSSTGPWSPCRLNVEQHHDWDATSIHSPPLQQLWLTAQHTLFNPRKRAPRLSWKPMFLSECYCSWWALINKPCLWNISDCIACTNRKIKQKYGMILWTGTCLTFRFLEQEFEIGKHR